MKFMKNNDGLFPLFLLSLKICGISCPNRALWPCIARFLPQVQEEDTPCTG
jgi:hypothetical protein